MGHVFVVTCLKRVVPRVACRRNVVNRAVDLRIVQKIFGMRRVLVRPVAGRIREAICGVGADVDRRATGQVMRNRAYITERQNRLTGQLTLDRQIEVLSLRIDCVRINPTREGIQRQVPIRRSKRRVAAWPCEGEVVGYGHASLDVLKRISEARIRRTRRGGGEWWSPQELKGLLFLGVVVVKSLSNPYSCLSNGSPHTTTPPWAGGKSHAR